ncbi:hypothetical protein HYDPIDRAFT_104448 [Hydnomerulius pinastri MD-312]|nr:hypothetical protein HYDPIDRAFT_104448 [Hydnomerulius pinastri MD-312]
MRPQVLVSSLLTVAGIAHAQYFSAGWAPGQPIPTLPAQQQQQQAARPAETAEMQGNIPPKPSFLDNLVTAGPISAITSLVGLNISGTPDAVWDARIPLITDSNYVDMIVNEEMTPEEEEKRVWFLLITVTAGQPEGVSKFVDNTFDAAYNYTLEKGDLEHVRFGRIDYLDVTAITTKWAVWSAPTLVVLNDRGQTLRFYKAGQIRLSDELLYQFLKEEAWRHKAPWKSAYSPGGDREFVLDYLALVMSAVYGWLVRVPKWLMYVISGGAATFIINLLHKPQPPAQSSSKPKAAVKPTVAPAAVAPKDEAAATATKGQKGGANKRKGRK